MIYHHLIDGRAVPGRLTFPTYAPGTGEVLAELARGDAADVDAAVASARRAWPAWAALDPYEKERILRRVGDVVMEHLDELAALEATDVGKPVAAARLIDVPRTADTFWYFSGWPTKLTGETLPVRGAVFTYTRREPIGVVAAIVPWNFPLLLAARKIAAALCAGNTVVVKPPEQASLSILRLGELLLEAGLPPGCCNVVTGLGPEAGAALVEHPGVGKITFTGGTVTGRAIMASASRTLKRVSLELGGKSPNIVFADADLDAAAKAAGPAVFYNQGEICTAGSRLLVERPAYERMVDAVAAAARALTPGDPLDPKTTLGPLITSQHRDRVLAYIASGRAEGAREVAGGALDRSGYYVAPTVFADVTPEMTIAREEIFGPVLSVIPFDSLEEAATLADATEFGLAAGVWTRDIGKAHALAARLQAGTVWVNTYNRFDAVAPYGGYKQSGIGRENGRAVLDEMTQLKTVWVAVP
jgi:acyl-CoA reductase-like NAD-dependent aldehyde dehydrogenase